MTSWSAEEALAQVYMSLPKGWKFKQQTVDRLTMAFIHDADGVEQWQSEEPLPDVRVIYLEAYGWLNTRGSEIRHPAWSRQREIDRRAVNERFGIRADTPDPQELDPDVIADHVRKEFG